MARYLSGNAGPHFRSAHHTFARHGSDTPMVCRPQAAPDEGPLATRGASSAGHRTEEQQQRNHG
eukprot:15440335-Alexandrium_andersonii.AAC.1